MLTRTHKGKALFENKYSSTNQNGQLYVAKGPNTSHTTHPCTLNQKISTSINMHENIVGVKNRVTLMKNQVSQMKMVKIFNALNRIIST